MKFLSIALLSTTIFFTASAVNAHSGGTNGSGCHTNHSTGDYHCHNPKSSSSTFSKNSKPLSGNTYYQNCTAARNNGATPIYRGEAGYRSALDRDDDGVACE